MNSAARVARRSRCAAPKSSRETVQALPADAGKALLESYEMPRAEVAKPEKMVDVFEPDRAYRERLLSALALGASFPPDGQLRFLEAAEVLDRFVEVHHELPEESAGEEEAHRGQGAESDRSLWEHSGFRYLVGTEARALIWREFLSHRRYMVPIGDQLNLLGEDAAKPKERPLEKAFVAYRNRKELRAVLFPKVEALLYGKPFVRHHRFQGSEVRERVEHFTRRWTSAEISAAIASLPHPAMRRGLELIFGDAEALLEKGVPRVAVAFQRDGARLSKALATLRARLLPIPPVWNDPTFRMSLPLVDRQQIWSVFAARGNPLVQLGDEVNALGHRPGPTTEGGLYDRFQHYFGREELMKQFLPSVRADVERHPPSLLSAESLRGALESDAAKQLSTRMRRVVELRAQDVSHQDIGIQLNTSEGNVKVIYRQALDLLGLQAGAGRRGRKRKARPPNDVD